MPVLDTKNDDPYAPADSCNESGTQFELDACALDKMYAANKKLNAAVLRRWQAADAEERRLLEVAQVRWLVAANAFCDWSVDVNRDGSVVGMTRPLCMADLADRQRRLLTESRGVTEGG